MLLYGLLKLKDPIRYLRPVVKAGHLFYSMPLRFYLLCVVNLVMCDAVEILLRFVLFYLCGGWADQFSMQAHAVPNH